MKKKAVVTGITGQDGSYLAEFLLSKGYEVYGVIRRSSSFNTGRLDRIYNDPHDSEKNLHLVFGDLNDGSRLNHLIRTIQPDEIYNLGAQSHVRVSFDVPEFTADSTGLGVLRLLDAIRETGHDCKFYQASSSEMFGKVKAIPQSETTPFYPRSPYGAAKVFGHWITVNYRESYSIFACSGILFNHESPRRGETFVTRKITRAVGRIVHGLQDRLYLGNLEAKRDWGFAGDYVEAMWLMLQQDEPDDYVVATGIAHSVKDFLKVAFDHVNLRWEDYVEVDPRYYRPAEVDLLLGDSSKARKQLGWKPNVDFPNLVRMMVENDLSLAEKEASRQSSSTNSI